MTQKQTPPLTGAELDKETWITRAAAKLQPYEFENAHAYAESLYDTYVMEYGEFPNEPERAVEEDMTYWGD